MMIIKAEVIHHQFCKSNIIFDKSEICYACEGRELFQPEGCDDHYNEVECIDIVFKNGKVVSLMKTDDLCRQMGLI